jgi:cobaltochelatase CobN
MHLLVRETHSLDAAAEAVELRQAAADVVVLSFSDADLAALAGAYAAMDRRAASTPPPNPLSQGEGVSLLSSPLPHAEGEADLPSPLPLWEGQGEGRTQTAVPTSRAPTLRLANLARLRHPMSVDLYLEQTIAHSRCVIVRLLGGLDYWRYGAEELAALCGRLNIPLAILPGDGGEDAALLGLSTVPSDIHARLDACFRHGGPDNMRRALSLAAHLAGRCSDDGQCAEPMPLHGVHLLDLTGRRLAVIVFYRSHLLSADIAPLNLLVAALREREFAVGVIYVASLKAPDTATFVTSTLAAWRPAVVLNATGFSARQDGASPLDAACAPVLQLVLSGARREAWAASSRGLSPSDLAMQVVLPELDGRLVTTAISFKAEDRASPELEYARIVHRPSWEGIAFAADRALGWARLSETPRAQRRAAIVLSDYPGLGGQIGHAVGLDSFASVSAILSALRVAGYDATDIASAEVRASLCDASPSSFLSLLEYERLFAVLPERLRKAVITRWGEPCEDRDCQNRSFLARHFRVGNVSVWLQPDRGSASDRRTSYHDPDSPPRHAYIALYLWLRGSVDALVHLGTHGSLEWLPGKAAALSVECWPSVLSGGLPVIYPFIVNNPGEAAAAKRRLGAVTIGHLTPPLKRAGSHGSGAELERMIDEYAAADGLDRRRTGALRSAILEHAASAGLLAESGVAPDARKDDALARLDAYLCDVKDLRIRDGLHVFGVAPDAERRALFVATMPQSVDAVDACAAAERLALLAALDGRFVQPGPAGAPSRGRADVLPTGRNLTGIDPRAVPTRSALTLAERAAADLLCRHRQDHGDWPRRIVINVWGTSTMRTGGEDLALALVLLGTRPVWDEGSARVSGFEIVPLAMLERPRVDVTLRVSGLFRDAFAAQVTLFDAAVQAVAARDESPEWNPLAGKGGVRVFGPANGCYGAGVGDRFASGDWNNRDDLGRAWLDASSAAYGRDVDGAHDAAALTARVRVADAFVHQQDNAETDLLDDPETAAHIGGFGAAAASLGATPALYHIDGKPRTVADQIARVVRGRAANPVWISGMMRHGYRGAAEIARGVESLAAYAATVPARFDAQFDLLFDATLGARDVEVFLRQENPKARAAMAARFDDARARGLWHPRRNAVGS